MLKHATPRSSPSFSNSGSGPLRAGRPSSRDNAVVKRSKSREEVSFNERSVDCEGIKTASPYLKESSSVNGFGTLLSDKLLSGDGDGIGPVITHGKAIVRRGLSFNGNKKDADSMSIRSVKSEGQVTFNSDVKPLQAKASSEVGLEYMSKSAVILDVKKLSNSDRSSTTTSENSSEQSVMKPSSNQDNSRKIYGLSKNDHPSLKSLLRLPGVYGHIPVPEGATPGSPHVINPDSLSLNSADSFFSSNSGRTSSRSWSSNTSSNSNNTSDSSASNNSSTSEPTSTTLKVYAKCLRSDIEYKTVNISSRVTCRQLINLLLSKARMKHRDPNLFYLTMEVTVRKWSGVPVRALLVLEETAKPSQLALCRPSGELRFVLQMRKGGIIKVHDTVLMPGSQYKSLLVSHRTTAEETAQLLLNCYNRRESKNHFALHEVCLSPLYKDRRLSQKEKPLDVKAEWPKNRKSEFVFVLRRNMSQALTLRKFSMLVSGNQTTDSKSPESSKEIPNSHVDNRPRGRSLTRTDIEDDDLMLDFTNVTPTVRVGKSSLSHQGQETFKSYNSQNQSWFTSKNASNELNRLTSTVILNQCQRNETRNNKSVTFNLTNNDRIPSHTDERIQIPKTAIVELQSNTKVSRPMMSTRDLLQEYQLYQTKHEAINTNYSHPNRLHPQITSFQPQVQISKQNEILVTRVNNEQEMQNSNGCHIASNTSPYIKIEEMNAKMDKLTQNNNCLTVKPLTGHKESIKVDSKTNNTYRTLLSSSVQTELTCIPLKGLKNNRWNSVETLLTTSLQDQKPKSKGIQQEDGHHKPGIHCERNCEKCFYI